MFFKLIVFNYVFFLINYYNKDKTVIVMYKTFEVRNILR